VTNISKSKFQHLTLVAYDQAGKAIGDTAITQLLDRQGQPFTNELVARNIVPGDYLTSLPGNLTNESFTALTTAEAQEVEDAARTAGLLQAGDDVLEYGFTIMNKQGDTHVLKPGQKGTLTVVLKLPLIDENAPREFSLSLLLTQARRERVTRLIGEPTARVVERARKTGAGEVALVGPDRDTAPKKMLTVRVPNIRVAGGADPVYLVDTGEVPAGCRAGLSPNAVSGTGPMISFLTDDASFGDTTRLLPLFREKGVVATAAVVSGQMLNPSSAFWLNVNGVRELQKAGWEIVSHSRTHPDLTTLTDEQLVTEFRDSRRELADNGFLTDTIVYPYGQQNLRVREAACKFYTKGFLAWGEVNELPLTTNFQIGRYALGAWASEGWNTPEFYKARVDEAIAKNGWLVFMLHPGDVDLHNAQQHEYLSQTIDYIKSRGVPIVTTGEALRRLSGN